MLPSVAPRIAFRRPNSNDSPASRELRVAVSFSRRRLVNQFIRAVHQIFLSHSPPAISVPPPQPAIHR